MKRVLWKTSESRIVKQLVTIAKVEDKVISLKRFKLLYLERSEREVEGEGRGMGMQKLVVSSIVYTSLRVGTMAIVLVQ